MQHQRNKENKMVNYCPVDRRSHSVINADIANIVAIILVLGTVTLSILILMAMNASAPSLTMSYSHPELINSTALNKSNIREEHVVNFSSGTTSFRYIEFCVEKDIHNAIISNYLSSDTGTIMLDSNPFTVEEGCYSANLPIKLPSNLPKGTYSLSSRIHGDVNSIKTFDTAFQELPVNIK